MRTAPWALAALLMAFGDLAVAQSSSRYASLEGVVFAELDRVGVPRDTVTKILYGERTLGSDENKRLSGIDAYVTLSNCERGSLIVAMHPNGRVYQVYTRRGCEVAGVPCQ